MSNIKRTVLGTVLFLFVFYIYQGNLYAGNKKVGLWVVRNQLQSKNKIDSVIKFARTNNITDLFVQVVGRGYSFYESEILPKNRKIKKPKFDPVQYVIKQTESKDINIHAWLNILLVWSDDQKPKKINKHIVLNKPDWFTYYKDGNSILNIDDKFLRKKGIPGKFIEPAKPEVKQYCVKIVRELVKNYSLEGIHLDYIRYPGPQFGYCNSNRKKFKNKKGTDPITLNRKREKDSRYSNMEKEWVKFRYKKIDSIVYNIKRTIEKEENDIQLSAAVKPDIYKARLYYLQDWSKWIEKEWVDFVIPMNYTSEKGIFYKLTQNIDEKTNINKVWMGIGTYNQHALKTDRQVRIIKNRNYTGVAFFSYQSTQDKNIYIKKYGLDQ